MTCARRMPAGPCPAEATHAVVADEPYLAHQPGAPVCEPLCLEHAEEQARRARAHGVYLSARVLALDEVQEAQAVQVRPRSAGGAGTPRPAGPGQLELLAGVGR